MHASRCCYAAVSHTCVHSQVWDFETIDNADITEDNTLFEMEPLVEIKVGLPSCAWYRMP